jgi:hypothetical protein
MLNQPLRPPTSAPPGTGDSARRESPRSAYNPITRQDVQSRAEWALFEGFESTSSRTVAGVLFVMILALGRGYLQFSGLLLLVLLVCLLYRMDNRERQIAGIPLAFSAIRIALGFTLDFPAGLQQSPMSPGSANPSFEAGLYWMPLLFSAYLFYSPWKSSHTSRLVFWYSLALLLSGLLPGDGYVYIAAMLFYTLFVAIGITLIIDFSSEKSAERPRPYPPVQPTLPGQPAQPAFS